MRSATSLTAAEIKEILDEALKTALDSDFIKDDPIQIPHRYSRSENIEISGLVSAIFSWGQRKTIINKASEFLAIMGSSPITFLLEGKSSGFQEFKNFKHRTFNGQDAFSVIKFLSTFYKKYESLEFAFKTDSGEMWSAEKGIENFRNLFIEYAAPEKRTLKHFSSPKSGSACKRINMYLRWMVRNDEVDFGIWKTIPKDKLICPLDVHVERVAESLGILSSDKKPWKKAERLTEYLCQLDANDPVKYDLALFTLGVQNRIP